jgi:hypothetical protein
MVCDKLLDIKLIISRSFCILSAERFLNYSYFNYISDTIFNILVHGSKSNCSWSWVFRIIRSSIFITSGF